MAFVDTVAECKVEGGVFNVRRVKQAVSGGNRLFLFAADPPNTVAHYDDLLAAMRAQFPRDEFVVFELPFFGMSKGDATMTIDTFCTLIANLIKAARSEFSPSSLVLTMPCVAGIIAVPVLQRVGSNCVDYLIVSQCGTYEAEHAWAHGVNTYGMLSIPYVSAFFNWLRVKSISSTWYSTTFPRRGNYTECTHCQDSEEGAQEMRKKFCSIVFNSFDNGATFPLASALQMLFFRPSEGDKALLEGLADAKNDVRTLLLWGGEDRTHRNTDMTSRAYEKYLSRPTLLDVHIIKDAAHFPELQVPKKFAAVAAKFIGAESEMQTAATRSSL